jgi:hypothetical protein
MEYQIREDSERFIQKINYETYVLLMFWTNLNSRLDRPHQKGKWYISTFSLPRRFWKLGHITLRSAAKLLRFTLDTLSSRPLQAMLDIADPLTNLRRNGS